MSVTFAVSIEKEAKGFGLTTKLSFSVKFSDARQSETGDPDQPGIPGLEGEHNFGNGTARVGNPGDESPADPPAEPATETAEEATTNAAPTAAGDDGGEGAKWSAPRKRGRPPGSSNKKAKPVPAARASEETAAEPIGADHGEPMPEGSLEPESE